MSEGLQLIEKPELVIGLVAPIGVDLQFVSEQITNVLAEVQYDVESVRLTDEMTQIALGWSPDPESYIESYLARIKYANEIRERLGTDALAALAISKIRSSRGEHWRRVLDEEELAKSRPDLPEDTAIPARAYLVRQFKLPDEIVLMRRVYGRHFILVSAFAPRSVRLQRIKDLQNRSIAGSADSDMIHSQAAALLHRDGRESIPHGQNLQDAFPLGDVFINAGHRTHCEQELRRFFRLLFGSNRYSPTRDEYGMYIAKSASLRSCDLSRQVGAAIFRPTGEVIAMGCNEVPKAGGGTYWTTDVNDARDLSKGVDPNEQQKLNILVDLLQRLSEDGYLSQSQSAPDLGKLLLRSGGSVKDSKLMDILEFGRIVHAELCAICDAARKGLAVEGATLFSTAFPCHLCAKHIVAAGIKRVVYLEPYPKSYAEELHSDSISIEEEIAGRVTFQPFMGVSPFRYRDLFEKGKRKVDGTAQEWNRGVRRPMIEVYFPAYFRGESFVAADLKKKIDGLNSAGSSA